MIIWSARPQRGPKAPLGNYQVQLTVGDDVQIHPFAIHMNPNIKGVAAEDLQQQFDLAIKIRNKTSAANDAVILIRSLRQQLGERLEQVDNEEFSQTAQSFLDKTSAIEQELYQVKNRSNQDPLNFPIKLNNRLASLRRSVENGDARPTDGAHQVFKELASDLEIQLTALRDAIDTELSQLNKLLSAEQLAPISAED